VILQRAVRGLVRMTVSSATRRSCARPQTSLERLTSRFQRGNANGRNRRILSVPTRSGGGLLTERTPAVQPRRREWAKVPHTCHSRYPSGSAQLGGEPTFADAVVNGVVAPKAALLGNATEGWHQYDQMGHAKRRAAYDQALQLRASGIVLLGSPALLLLTLPTLAQQHCTGPTLGVKRIGMETSTPACDGGVS
jgi:hypothetical protein